MKKAFCISAFSLFFLCANAQQKILVADKEHLFTTEEISRVDSLLQDYHKRSGNLVVVCTDTLDVSAKTYKDSLIKLYTGDKPIKPYAVFLLLSRKNSTVRLESNDLPTDSSVKKDLTKTEKEQSVYITEDRKEGLEEFMKIVTYGLPAFKEKKLEEGVTIICQKAMEFLDTLPKKETNQ